MRQLFLTSVALVALTGTAFAGGCPEATVADMNGVAAGEFPQQFELAEFEAAGNCTLSFLSFRPWLSVCHRNHWS